MDDNAPFLDMPNNMDSRPRSPIKYGSTPVPHPTNEAAKHVDAAKVMRQVNEAK